MFHTHINFIRSRQEPNVELNAPNIMSTDFNVNTCNLRYAHIKRWRAHATNVSRVWSQIHIRTMRKWWRIRPQSFNVFLQCFISRSRFKPKSERWYFSIHNFVHTWCELGFVTKACKMRGVKQYMYGGFMFKTTRLLTGDTKLVSSRLKIHLLPSKTNAKNFFDYCLHSKWIGDWMSWCHFHTVRFPLQFPAGRTWAGVGCEGVIRLLTCPCCV